MHVCVAGVKAHLALPLPWLLGQILKTVFSICVTQVVSLLFSGEYLCSERQLHLQIPCVSKPGCSDPWCFPSLQRRSSWVLFRFMWSSRVPLPGLAVHHGALLGWGGRSSMSPPGARVTCPSSAVSGSRLSLGERWDTGLVRLCPGGIGDAGRAAACPGGSCQPQPGGFPKLGHI